MTDRVRSSSSLRVSGVTERMEAPSTALSGMTLGALPDWNFPTVITAMSPGVALRETTVCSAITISEPVTMGSTPSCGMEPWEPFP